MRRGRGRPVENYRLRDIMDERGCSRTWAYVLLRRERAAAAKAVEDGEFGRLAKAAQRQLEKS